MALSGTIINNFKTGYRLRVEWNASQNISANQSTISVYFYLDSLSSGYNIVANDLKPTQLLANGTTWENTGEVNVSLSGNQQKLLVSMSRTVTHNNDGTWSGEIGGYIDFQGLNVNGAMYSYYCSQVVSLDTIPRASTVSSGISWTAGVDNLPISLNIASSSFHHTLEIWIRRIDDVGSGYDFVGSRTNIGSSTTWVFTQAEVTQIYTTNSGYENRPILLRVYTYDSGGSQIGSYQDKMGTVYAVPTGVASLSTFNIGDSVPITINGFTSGFTYDVSMQFGSFSKSWNGVTTNTYTLTFTAAEVQSLYAQVSSANSGTGAVTVRTKYNGVSTEDGVPTGHDTNFTANVTNSNPTFGTGYTYSDTNATTTGITGNNQYVIQNKSTLQIQIPTTAAAAAINGASMVRYEATINGVTVSANYSSSATVTIDLGVVNASANTTLTIKAVDSRSNSTSTSKTVLMVPYAIPVVTANATRLNNFDAQTTLTLSGSLSPLNVNGTNKNAVVSAKYQYRQSGGTYNALIDFTVSGFPSYSATNVTLTLDNTLAWDISVVVTDKLGSTTVVKPVSAGKPIIFYDSKKSSVGINKFPVGNGTFEVAGDISASGNFNISGGITASGDINIGTNQLFGHLGSESIPRNADLNSYTEEGLYYCPLNVDVQTMLNRPTDNAFTLVVQKHAGTRQTITTYMTTGWATYERNLYSTTWGPWRRTNNDVPLAFVAKGSGQSLGVSAWNRAVWNNVYMNDASMLNTSNNMFTVPDEGYFLITYFVRINQSINSWFTTELWGKSPNVNVLSAIMTVNGWNQLHNSGIFHLYPGYNYEFVIKQDDAGYTRTVDASTVTVSRIY